MKNKKILLFAFFFQVIISCQKNDEINSRVDNLSGSLWDRNFAAYDSSLISKRQFVKFHSDIKFSMRDLETGLIYIGNYKTDGDTVMLFHKFYLDDNNQLVNRVDTTHLIFKNNLLFNYIKSHKHISKEKPFIELNGNYFDIK